MSGTEWLSKGAEQLFRKLQEKEKLGEGEAHYDVVVVGSGYGGSVAAARLAGTCANGAELRVCLLERGREYVPGDFPEHFAELPGYVRFNRADDPDPKGGTDALFDVRLGSDVSALVGNGLGGGSLINAGVLAEPAPDAFARGWPRELSSGSVLQPYYLRTKEMLGARKIPDPKPAKLVALEALSRVIDPGRADCRADIAVTFEPGANRAGVLQQPCIRCGDCFTGCNHWAKNTLPMNYLALAQRRGAELFTGATVYRVRPLDDGARWVIELGFTDREVARNYAMRCQAKPDQPFKLIAHRVVLAAGTFGSTEILLRSRDAGLHLSAKLGQSFSANGDMLAAAVGLPFPTNASATECVTPTARSIGPTITGLIDLRQSGDPRHTGIAIEELAVPGPLRRAFEETVTTGMALHDLLRADCTRHRKDDPAPDTAAINPQQLERTIVYATMGNDDAEGNIEQVPGCPQSAGDGAVRVRWPGVAEKPIFKRAIDVLKKAHSDPKVRATALPSPLWQPVPSEIADVLDTTAMGGTIFTVHPLGGCAMADSANQGVVNHLGQVFKHTACNEVYENLVVLDGSIVPSALGINPCLTITAVAEYAVAELAKLWSLRDCTADHLETLPPVPAPRRGPFVTANRPTQLRFAERMTGIVTLGKRSPLRRQAYHAKLTLHFEPIPDLQAMLAQQCKVVPLQSGHLRVRARAMDGPGPVKEWCIPVSGQLRLFERDGAGPIRRIVRAVWAWLCNGGLRDIWQSGRKPSRGRSLLCKVADFFRLASRAGEVRRLIYDLVLEEELKVDEKVTLPAGGCLEGKKVLAYRPRSNPWDQFTRLKLSCRPFGEGKCRVLGELRADLPYFVSRYASTFQLASQTNQPTALSDLFSFGAYLARLIGRIHFWTFRAPDYPDPYPVYEFGRTMQAQARGENRIAFRLPGTVKGIDPPEVFPLPTHSGASEGQCLVRVTRYRPRTGKENALGPVVLIHGLGAGGNTFTIPSVQTSLVKHLVADCGFDCWVLDLRTSIGLPSSESACHFEDVAYLDVARAINHACEQTGKKVNVVAHCIGAAMLCMAVLDNKIPPARVRAVVLSQVGPLLHMPQWNVLRGYITGYLRYFIKVRDLNATAPRSASQDFVDRLLSALPQPRGHWSSHHPLWPFAKVPHEAFCNRITGIYAPLYVHENLGPATLRILGDQIGHVPFETYLQTVFYATERRLTDFVGRNRYVTPENVCEWLCFPICFLHGKENRVFDVRTSRESFRLLAMIFRPGDLTA